MENPNNIKEVRICQKTNLYGTGQFTTKTLKDKKNQKITTKQIQKVNNYIDITKLKQTKTKIIHICNHYSFPPQITTADQHDVLQC